MAEKKPLPPTYLLLSIILMTVLKFIFPVAEIIADPWNLVGFLPLVIGVIINLLADKEFKTAQQ